MASVFRQNADPHTGGILTPPIVPLAPHDGQVAVRWLGQGGFALRSPAGVVWLVDPYLSCYGRRAPVERLAPAPVRGKDVRADAVFCTHAHGDHTDPVTLPEIALASPSCRFYAAAEGATTMRELGIADNRIRTVTTGERGIEVGPDVTVDVVYASHSGDAVGYVFSVGLPASSTDTAAKTGSDTGPVRVYITGDSLYEPQLISEMTRAVDLLCVCINGRMGNMDHEDAARLAGEVGARAVVPMHYGVMPHNTADPQDFLDALTRQSVAATPRVLAIGETALFSR